uniref:Uncharacterized protein n=1 Tax=Anguilla anguilla TaxID=7936 RepID=A0A0E9UPR2_ANGAN
MPPSVCVLSTMR